ncbi:Uncharacterized protein dnm_005280 [Desulfonema magnum]|uniref:Uncharacterized protein n=1 Tax=Desulfonema magnum TaxID=45655 RepID=A0A975BFQ8_9BACT|nr:Uncharacterized protein dnm_005280 [Desulfonema magnum]
MNIEYSLNFFLIAYRVKEHFLDFYFVHIHLLNPTLDYAETSGIYI